MSLEQLAAKAGVDVGVVSRLESGLSFNPPVSVLCRLARALDRNLVLGMDETRPHS